MKKLMNSYLYILYAIFFLSACGKSTSPQDTGSSPDENSKEEKQVRIALVMKSLANEFFINMANGAEEHQKTNSEKYSLTVNGIKNESDLAQQVNLVEQMIASKMDVIVIAPANSKSLVPVIKKAVDAGIVVVNIDNKLDDDVLNQSGLNIPFVGPDNKEGAYKVGKYLADTLSEDDKVAIIGGIPGAFNAQQRQAGFEQAIEEKGLNLISAQSAGWEQSKAATIAAAIINENPDLKAIMAANDAMALGAVAAIRQAGKTGSIKVVGFDNISAANDLIATGELLATADQYGDRLAVFGIEYALEILQGGKTPEDKKTPVDLVVGE